PPRAQDPLAVAREDRLAAARVAGDAEALRRAAPRGLAEPELRERLLDPARAPLEPRHELAHVVDRRLARHRLVRRREPARVVHVREPVLPRRIAIAETVADHHG